MGRLFDFTCPACDYRAEVTGAQDSGMISVTQTITCLECRELLDVNVGEWDRPLKEPQCPEDPQHRVQPWTAGEPCPRCGTPIKRGPSTLTWD